MKVAILTLIGVALLAGGILFALQGAGLVRWPAESFMIGNRDWIERGILFALFGIAALLGARRIR